MDPFQNGGFKGSKCRDFGHKLEDCDKASTYISEALFVEEEMVQYCDENVVKYCNNVPVFDKPASEEDEAIVLMVLATYLTPKQNSKEIIEEDGDEHHGDGHALSLFPKMQDVYDVLPTIDDLIEPKVEDSLHDFFLLSPVQVSPKVRKDFMGQLKDPLEMLFTRASLGYNVGANLLSFMAYGSWYIVEECLVNYYDDILVSKRHAKLVAYLHICIVAVDVHKRKLVLKMGYLMIDIILCLNT